MTFQASHAISERTICLVGNPNTGKSVLFSILTGTYVTVSNYPGTTVEVMKGSANLHGKRQVVIDTPGTNSLTPMSEDEKVTRDILLDQPPDLVLQVGDAKNLKRVLRLTVQLAEMGLPMVLALNMTDEASFSGIQVDSAHLQELVGIPVVPTVAIERKGIERLTEALAKPAAPQALVSYPPAIERAVCEISWLLPEDCASRRGAALMILSGDESLNGWLERTVPADALRRILEIRDALAQQSATPVGQCITRQQVLAVQRMYAQVVLRTQTSEGRLAAWLGRTAMHPVGGVALMVVILYVVYKFVGVLGAGTLVGLIEEGLFEEYINPAARALFALVPSPLVHDLFVGEFGIITMALTYGLAIVMPVVFTFFLAFSILEDSGYLPRLAVMVNQMFRAMGLNGKAVLPMMLGLGCDTMATLTTRVLDTPRERTIVTLLLALGVPCSAQLAVVMAMLGGDMRALAIWGSVVLIVMLAVGYLAGKVMPGSRSDFILEIPPVRPPKIGNIVKKTLARTEWYIKEAVPLFVLGTMVLFVLDRLNRLQTIEKAAAPVVTGILGMPEQAARAFIMGFLRRDYGGAGLSALQQQGLLDMDQVIVGLVTITLFVPCIANFFVMIKERGWKTAFAQAAFIVPLAVIVGGLVRLLLSSGIL